MNDPINHPKHYQMAPGVEAFDIIAAALTPQELRGYLLGNILKYRLRAGEKGDPAICIGKANWYRDKLESLKGGR